MIPSTGHRIRVCSINTWLPSPCILSHCRHRLLQQALLVPLPNLPLLVLQNSGQVSYLQNIFSNFQPRLKHFCMYHAPEDGSYYHHILIFILNITKSFLKTKLQLVLHKFSTLFRVWKIEVNISYTDIYCMIFEHAESEKLKDFEILRWLAWV